MKLAVLLGLLTLQVACLSYMIWVTLNGRMFSKQYDALNLALETKINRKLKGRAERYELYNFDEQPLRNDRMIHNHIKRSLRPFTNPWKAYPVFVWQMMSKDPWKNYHSKKVTSRQIRFYTVRKLHKRVKFLPKSTADHWDYDCWRMSQHLSI